MVLDLSSVTDGLIKLVKDAWTAAPLWQELGATTPTFTPAFSGLAPDAVRAGPGPQLSIFLYHVESDAAHEASLWSSQMLGRAGAPVSYLPLALDLYYLLSAFSETSYVQEQQAMSIAMRAFHAQPLIASDTSATPAWQLTLTLEHRSYDELSALWQATSASLRMGVVYRAAVVFLTPDLPAAPAKQVQTVKASVKGDIVAVTQDS